MQKDQRWLVITEKPSVAADIAKALGGFEKVADCYESKDLILTWAVGHLLELLEPEAIDPKYKRWLLQDLPIIPTEFQYKPKHGQKERLETIKSIAKKTGITGFVNACDAGREGELIFREIYEYCAQSKPIKRLWLQSMTTAAIRTEFKNLRSGKDFENLFDAARCRSESDWLIGMNATRAVTRRLSTRAQRGSSWSVGRVQTPTLALVVKREMETLRHRAEPYWTIEGRFSTSTHEYSGQWYDPSFRKSEELEDEESLSGREKDNRIFTRAQLDAVLTAIQAAKTNAFATETRKESREIPPQLFDLTTLQREANRRFGMTANRTLQAAQRLYEREKALTYPRTDSRHLPEDYVQTVEEVIKKFSASDSQHSHSVVCKRLLKNGLLNKERVFDNRHISDHFAIIPTGEFPHTLDGDDGRIFELVLRRFLAAFMPHAVWDRVERITTVGKQTFRTKVQDLQIPGWREVYGLDSETESKLPKLEGGARETGIAVDTIGVDPLEELTKAPPRHSEAKLLGLMEHCGRAVSDEDIAEALKNKGLGTPATRAEVIENLIRKEYLVRSGKALRPTVKGIRLVDILSRVPVAALSSVELTGEMEFKLREMESGKTPRTKYMEEMIQFTHEIVNKVKEFDYTELFKTEAPLGTCPACKQGQVRENFWNYKCDQTDCEFVIWKEKNQRYVDRSLVSDILKNGSVGPLEFFAMSGSSYQAWIKISEKGLYLVDEHGEPMEALPGTPTKVLHEERIESTFLGFPGKIIETETSYICEFETGPEEVAPVAAPKRRKKAETATENNPEKPAKKVKKPVKKRKLVARMPKTLCQRPMSLQDFKSYVASGSTPPFLDFKSKKNRPFGAFLNMKTDGNFEFKFVSRKVLSGNTEGDNTETVKKPRAKRSTSKAKVVKKVDSPTATP